MGAADYEAFLAESLTEDRATNQRVKTATLHRFQRRREEERPLVCQCGKLEEEHLWRCALCMAVLPKDEHGLPAVLCCDRRYAVFTGDGLIGAEA